MTAKQNRTTTANTGKPTTAEKAAGKQQPAIRDAIQKQITALRKVNTTLSNTVYKAAMVAREVEATEAENSALLKEIPKQRRAEYKTIVGAPAEHWGDKAPSNLTKLAKYLTYRAEGQTDATAAQWAEKGKPKSSKGPDSRKDGEPAADAPEPAADAPEGTPEGMRQTGHVIGDKPQQGPLAMIRDGINQLQDEYPNDKTIQQACRALSHALDTAGKHLAKIA